MVRSGPTTSWVQSGCFSYCALVTRLQVVLFKCWWSIHVAYSLACIPNMHILSSSKSTEDTFLPAFSQSTNPNCVNHNYSKYVKLSHCAATWRMTLTTSTTATASKYVPKIHLLTGIQAITQNTVLRAHPSTNPKLHHDQFIRFCRAHA